MCTKTTQNSLHIHISSILYKDINNNWNGLSCRKTRGIGTHSKNGPISSITYGAPPCLMAFLLPKIDANPPFLMTSRMKAWPSVHRTSSDKHKGLVVGCHWCRVETPNSFRANNFKVVQLLAFLMKNLSQHTWTEMKLNSTYVYLGSKGAVRTPSSRAAKWAPTWYESRLASTSL